MVLYISVLYRTLQSVQVIIARSLNRHVLILPPVITLMNTHSPYFCVKIR